MEVHVEHPHCLPLKELISKLGSGDGLSTDEAKIRQGFGPNKIITPAPSIWKLYLAPLLDVLIVVYLIMTAIMLFLSIFVEGLIAKITFWLILIAFNMLLAIFQQFRAQKKLDSLQDLSPPMTRVWRDNKLMELRAEELVVGDVIEIGLGDKIPADARIIDAASLSINEASLTGESEPASKYSDGSRVLDADTPIGSRKTMLYLGTFVQTGEAKAVVTAIGNNTELGKIASAMSEMQTMEIPLRKKINFLGKALSTLMVSFLLILLIFTGIQRSRQGETLDFDRFAFDMAQGIINAMAVMPINIPLLTTVVLITGVLNMAKSKVVIKNLSAVETLGRVSTICTDKTGTLTTSVMTAKMLYDTKHFYSISQKDEINLQISPLELNDVDEFMHTQIMLSGAVTEIDSGSTLGLLLTSAVLNNKAKIEPMLELDGSRQIGWQVSGNPTDAALLILAKMQGFDENYITQRYVPEKMFPFNSTVKRMSGIFLDSEERDHMIFVKGASEVILPLCTRMGDESSPSELDDERRENILKQVNEFADEGYRVISLAYRSIKTNSFEGEDEELRLQYERDLSFVGFVVIFDPPRPGVSKAVADLESAGVYPIMITGDSPNTAATIARQIGILNNDEIVVTGNEIADLDDTDFFKVSVFARVSPQDKEIIVNKYQQRGQVIAMAGDGVNDALAITKSDVGVAMGKAGTEVTKDAAGIILTDDSYLSLVRGVDEGRNLFEKIRMMVFFYIAVNLAEAIIYFSSSFRLDFQILNNWQRVYIFGIIHSIPVFALIFGPRDNNAMKLKPRENADILSKPLVVAIAIYSLTLALGILGIYALYYNGIFELNNTNRGGIFGFIEIQPSIIGDNSDFLLAETYLQAKARTMLLTILYLSESLLVLVIRRMNAPLGASLKDANRVVWVSVLTGIVIHFSIMYILPLQRFLLGLGLNLELVRLSFVDMFFAISVALLPLALIELLKYYFRQKNRQF